MVKCKVMGRFRFLSLVLTTTAVSVIVLLLNSDYVNAQNIDNQHYMPPLECYDPYGRPQVIIPELRTFSVSVTLFRPKIVVDSDQRPL